MQMFVNQKHLEQTHLLISGLNTDCRQKLIRIKRVWGHNHPPMLKNFPCDEGGTHPQKPILFPESAFHKKKRWGKQGKYLTSNSSNSCVEGVHLGWAWALPTVASGSPELTLRLAQSSGLTTQTHRTQETEALCACACFLRLSAIRGSNGKRKCLTLTNAIRHCEHKIDIDWNVTQKYAQLPPPPPPPCRTMAAVAQPSSPPHHPACHHQWPPYALFRVRESFVGSLRGSRLVTMTQDDERWWKTSTSVHHGTLVSLQDKKKKSKKGKTVTQRTMVAQKDSLGRVKRGVFGALSLLGWIKEFSKAIEDRNFEKFKNHWTLRGKNLYG